MSGQTPILLIPGLACTPRLYAAQLPALWQAGPVMVANHTTADSTAGIAGTILAAAPPRFHLAGLSMGGYIAFEIMRQAPERVDRLALLDTAAYPDTPERIERRRALIAMAEEGRLLAVNDVLWPLLVHEARTGDRALRAVADEMLVKTGAAAFVRQVRALIGRPDFRPGLAAIRSETLVICGDGDRITPPAASEEIAAGIAGARLEFVAGCGHLSTLERPEAVTKLLSAWFAA